MPKLRAKTEDRIEAGESPRRRKGMTYEDLMKGPGRVLTRSAELHQVST